MNLVLTLLVKNEADVIDANIRYHLSSGVSHIIATDNGSDDGTREILEEYANDGVLTLIDEPGKDYSQWKWVTRMAALARDRLKATWIINGDADEFWWHPEHDLAKALSRARSHVLDCERDNLVFAATDHSQEPWPEWIVYRSDNRTRISAPADRMSGALQLPYFLHRLPTKAIVRAEGLVSVSQGNHDARYSRPVRRTTSKIRVLHVPIRSPAQLASKVMSGGAAYDRNTELPVEAGWHWRRWYRMLRDSGIETVLHDALPTAQMIADGLQEGSIIRDLTLKHALESIEPIIGQPGEIPSTRRLPTPGQVWTRQRPAPI